MSRPYLKQPPRVLAKKYETIDFEEHERFKAIASSPHSTEYSFNAGMKNPSKNRYSDVLPYDSNRVILGKDGYINASQIDVAQKYIATQGPLRSTAADFWQMCDEQCASKIVVVCLTPLFEKQREKCFKYWSDTDFRVRQADGKVLEFKMVGQERRPGGKQYTKTRYEMGPSKKPVVHYYFDQWADFSRPEGHEHILALDADVEHERCASDPLVVHCSAGVGRTGTYIALNWMMSGGAIPVTGSEDPIEEAVKTLRKQRMLMVQRPQQYQFIYDTLASVL